jgi:hypothetical protein
MDANGKPQTVSELYPEKWLKPHHLKSPVTVRIARAEVEEFRMPDGSHKNALVLTFEKATKRLICNKTQVHAAMAAIGDEHFAAWVGHSLTLAPGVGQTGKPTIVISAAPTTYGGQ